MKEFVVLSETGVVLEGADDTVHVKGTVLELDPENEQVKALLENETIAEVMPDSETEDFVVTEEFLVANPAVADAGIKVGDTIRVPKAVVADEAEESVAEVAAEPVLPSEPVLVYRGQNVVSHTTRTVEDKEYHNVRLADGSSTDVTDQEWSDMNDSANAVAGLTEEQKAIL